MHLLEPHYTWIDFYEASKDPKSPFFNHQYNEFYYTNTIYNYYIHPQWDDIESETLYLKILYCNYNQQIAVIELIGEWNDAIGNDIMLLKKNVLDKLIKHKIYKFILIGENVLNFHGDGDAYYADWNETLADYEGWVVAINFEKHVVNEMKNNSLHYYLHFFDLNWRAIKPMHLLKAIEILLTQLPKSLL